MTKIKLKPDCPENWAPEEPKVWLGSFDLPPTEGVEWFVIDAHEDNDLTDVYMYNPISVVDPPQSKMSPEQAEKILKRCGILDENGEIVEAFKDILSKR